MVGIAVLGLSFLLLFTSLFQKKPAPDPNSIGGRTAIGYWHETADGRSSVLDAVDKDWDADERQMVISYLQLASDNGESSGNGPKVLASWRGLSFCRLCDEATGNSCHGDEKYNWPQGYLHYVEKHDMKPPQEFIKHVRTKME